jgi:hypothetical protein
VSERERELLLHRCYAYQCIACRGLFCMVCDRPTPDETSIKTAVRWCSARPCRVAKAKDSGGRVPNALDLPIFVDHNVSLTRTDVDKATGEEITTQVLMWRIGDRIMVHPDRLEMLLEAIDLAGERY